MKVLITGFEPFENETINPALEAVMALDNSNTNTVFVKTRLPTVFKKVLHTLQATLEHEKPDITICVGQAKNSVGIRVERVAINLDDARIPDNEGQQPLDESIYPDAPNAYFTNLPAKAMVTEIQKQKIPAIVSYSAGTFVCNHVMYGLLHLIHTCYPTMKGGFIHVPYAPEQVIDKPNTPSMALSTITQGLQAAICAAVEYDEDIEVIGGTLQ